MPRVLWSHPLASYCQKVLIALYELDLPFSAPVLDLLDPGQRAAFLRISPRGKMPALQDGERVVLESSIIIEYLDRDGLLVPRDRERALEVRELDRFFDLYVQDPMQKVNFDRLRAPGDRDPVGVTEARTNLRTSYDILEARLGDRTWAAGETFGLADCSAAPALFYATMIEPFDAWPRVAAYAARVEARPSVARMRAEAEPYMHLVPR